jgi:hypothetical protein
MIASVFPFRTILLQILVLFLAIAIESWFLQKLLKLGPKTSVEYAALLNLSCTCMGWLLFFGIESVLSKDLRERLIDYILLGGERDFYFIITGLAILILTVTFLAKWQSLELLENTLYGKKKTTVPTEFKRSFTLTRRPPKRSFKVSTQFGAIFISHTVSNCLILTVLFFQNID